MDGGVGSSSPVSIEARVATVSKARINTTKPTRFPVGFGLPQFGQTFASVLISLPHSLHFFIAIRKSAAPRFAAPVPGLHGVNFGKEINTFVRREFPRRQAG